MFFDAYSCVSPGGEEGADADFGAVLEACERLGYTRIRSRKGRVRLLCPEAPEPLRTEGPSVDFAARRHVTGIPQMTK